MHMKHVLALLLIVPACLNGQTSAATESEAQAKKNELTNAASAGTPLPASINVSANVNIEAVMLPRDVARSVFGKEVADHYAIIEVNISNRSNEAGLILQGLYIDLRDWALAGPIGSALGSPGLKSVSQSVPFEAKADPRKVSSVEYRIVRGELLDRQARTARNQGIRYLQILGSIGTAFAFPFTPDVVTGIGAWNGAVVPGFRALFPDGTQPQLDRISDFGFRNNKVISQQSADIVVAFFPIGRFLTPTLQRIFLDTPSLFFNPVLMVLDPATRKKLNPILTNVFRKEGEVDTEFTSLMKAYGKLDQVAVATAREQWQEDLANIAKKRASMAANQEAIDQDKASRKNTDEHTKAFKEDQDAVAKYETTRDKDRGILDKALNPLTTNRLYNLLSSLSLNNVHIVVSGIMAIDVDSVPPIITSIECVNDDQPALIWGDAGERSCAIRGSFLTGGTPAIAETTSLDLTVGAVADGSTDAVLNMKLTLKKPVPPRTILTFQVNKKNKQGNTVESMKFRYTVPDYTLPTPSIAKVAAEGTTVTVTGSNFYDLPASPLSVTAHAIAPAGLSDQKIDKPTRTLTQIQFDDKSFSPACWQVQVKVGAAQVPASSDKPPKDQFAILPVPKMDSAMLNGTKVTVSGTQLMDLAECGAPLTFAVLSDATGAQPQAIAKVDLSPDGKQATFDVPALAQGANWKEVHALLNGKQAATIGIK